MCFKTLAKKQNRLRGSNLHSSILGILSLLGRGGSTAGRADLLGVESLESWLPAEIRNHELEGVDQRLPALVYGEQSNRAEGAEDPDDADGDLLSNILLASTIYFWRYRCRELMVFVLPSR